MFHLYSVIVPSLFRHISMAMCLNMMTCNSLFATNASIVIPSLISTTNSISSLNWFSSHDFRIGHFSLQIHWNYCLVMDLYNLAIEYSVTNRLFFRGVTVQKYVLFGMYLVRYCGFFYIKKRIIVK